MVEPSSKPHSKMNKPFASCQPGNKQAQKPELSIADLMPGLGSAAVDLVIDKHLTLSPEIQCYKITTGVYGSSPSGTVGMTLEGAF